MTQKNKDKKTKKESEPDLEDIIGNDDDKESGSEDNDVLDKLVSGEDESQKADAEEAKKWEQRFKSLQGKYNAEVPRLSKKIRELEEELQRMKQTRDNRSDEKRPPEKRYLDPELEGMFGDEQIEFTSRVAKGIGEEMIGKIKNEVDAVKRNIFNMTLRQKVEDIDELENDPQFIEWMKTHSDPISGFSYYALFANAYENCDPIRAARIIEAYRGKTDKAAAKPQEEASEFNLEPGGAQGSSGAETAEVEELLARLSPEKIATIYRERATGKLRHLDEQAWRRIEERIHKARTAQAAKGG